MIRDISDTVLYKLSSNYDVNNLDNTLVPCLKYNNYEFIHNLAKNSHTDLVYQCIDCDKRLIKRADTVAHKNRNCRCPFCCWDNHHEQFMNNILYNTVRKYNKKKIHEIVNVQENIEIDGVRYRPDCMIRYKNRVLMIELDGDSHLKHVDTMAADIIKMREARAQGWSVLRILLENGDTITQDIERRIKKAVNKFMRKPERFEVYLNDPRRKIQNNFINI